MRRTKIVATLGPASAGSDVISALLKDGVDVFRCNFSHGTGPEHVELIRMIRRISRELGSEVAIIQDLCGPKIRIGEMADGWAKLESGREVTVTSEQVLGNSERFSTNYETLAKDVNKGDKILLDDGSLELRVKAITQDVITCSVIRGGVLRSRKGLNLPDTVVSSPSITAKDMQDLQIGIAEGVDFVALSFVRHPDDIQKVREVLEINGSPIQIIAKIEKREAVENIDEIIAAADGILVARGDLGVEMDLERVPILQKDIIRRANEQDKYVLVATQMLDSMVRSAVPTRAEVSDVTNAILDGADALMLSGETAVGAFPLEAVQMMDRISRETEAHLIEHPPAWDWQRISQANPVQDAIGSAVFQLCGDLDAASIVAFSASGGTALFLSKSRPFVPIIAFTGSVDAQRRMRLFWGVVPVLTESIKDKDDLLAGAKKYLGEHNIIQEGKPILLVAGAQFGQVGSTNLVEVAY